MAPPVKKTNGLGISTENVRICIVMVGLPARGKSLIARKAMRYFKWLGIEAKVFNVGEYRRTDAPTPSSNFFDASNPEGAAIRRHAAEAAMKDMIEWFDATEDTIDQGTIAIFDATNSTKERRRWIADECAKHNIEPLYIESFCDDEDLIKSNIREVKLSSPDYKGRDPEEAVKDFQDRIKNYEKVYQSMNADGDEKDLSYTKITNVGASVMINQVKNYLQSRIVYYLMNLHIRPRSIWLSRHGESEYNLTGQIGGDASLSPNGKLYARKLPSMLRASVGDDRPLTVWTSTLQRTIATASFLPPHHRILQWKALDELDAGVCDGLTYAEIAEKYPEDFQRRDEDKYNYRYMGGESYKDVVTRLEPIIMELERGGDILIVTHQAVLRCVLAYFIGKRQVESPWMNVPLHTLIKLTPRAYATDVEMVPAHIEAVSTWRGKGSTAKHEMVVPEEYDALKG